MALPDLPWRTSSFSGSNGDACAEVALIPGGGVAVCDTKDRSPAPHRYPTAAWRAFLPGVRAGEVDRP